MRSGVHSYSAPSWRCCSVSRTWRASHWKKHIATFRPSPRKRITISWTEWKLDARQKTPELDAIASTLRKLLDARKFDVQSLGTGKLQTFYKNYFPHIWKKPSRAKTVFGAFFGKRPLEGGKSFLKKRKLPTIADGLAAGLEPVSDNPVDLVLGQGP